jgi:hypothetical protein
MRDTRLFCYLDGETVWEYLETGKNIDELYPDEFREEIQTKKLLDVAKKFLMEGEQIYLFPLDGPARDYSVTSFGRGFNLRTEKQISSHYKSSSDDIFFYIREKKYYARDIFKKQNWNYDVKEIFSYYKKNRASIYNSSSNKQIFI